MFIAEINRENSFKTELPPKKNKSSTILDINYRTAPKSWELYWLFPALVRAQGSRELQNSKGSRKQHLSRKLKR